MAVRAQGDSRFDCSCISSLIDLFACPLASIAQLLVCSQPSLVRRQPFGATDCCCVAQSRRRGCDLACAVTTGIPLVPLRSPRGTESEPNCGAGFANLPDGGAKERTYPAKGAYLGPIHPSLELVSDPHGNSAVITGLSRQKPESV